MAPRGEVRDITAIIHSRLRAAANLHGALEGLIRCRSERPDLNDLIGQVEQRISNRANLVATRTPGTNEPWMADLAFQIQHITDPARRRRALQDVLIYRDRWAITDTTNPLGTPAN